jgi:acetyl esterase/lipase
MAKLALLVVLAAGHLLAQADKPAGMSVPDWVQVEANISYDRYPQTVLDILQPKAPALAKRPGVIVIHGGGWVGGAKERMLGTCLRYLEEGFVVANVEYRLAEVATAPAAVTDVLEAAQWFRENANRYKMDAKRIVVTGGSAGGHLALMVGMTPKSARLGPETKVAAVVNFYGITDVADLLPGPNMRKFAVTWVPERQGRVELARRVSPMTYVRKDVPAILTIHGDEDPTVPYEHGTELTRALRNADADAELISVHNGKHGGFGEEGMARIYKDVFKFLKKRKIIGD